MADKILIVDDSYYMRTMLRDILTDAGHGIAGEAPNGAEAIELAATLSPDLILLDVILPDITGMDVLKKIIANNPKAKVLMISAVGNDDVHKQAVKDGALDFILKPFSEEEVLAKVRKALIG